MVVVFNNLEFAVFQKSLPLVKQGRRHGITAPLCWTAAAIRNSADVFPIEFTEIKFNHVLIFGTDIFTGLSIDPKNVRLFCEAQVKGKIVRIRQAYLESGGNAHIIRHIMTDSLNSLIPVFREVLRLKGNEPAAAKEDVLKQLGPALAVDTSALVSVYQYRNRKFTITAGQAETSLQAYLAGLDAVAARLDVL